MKSNKKHFILNLISSYGNTLLTAILSFISVPIALHYWDRELYGVWTILLSFSSYISASGLGIDCSTGILATKNSNYDIKLSIVKKGFKLLFICSIFVGLILAGITIFIPDWLKLVGNMETTNFPIVKKAGIIFIIGLIVNLPFNSVANSLQSIGKAYLNTFIGTLQSVINFLIILVTVNLKLTLPVYVLLQSLNMIAMSIVKVIVFMILYNKEKVLYYQEHKDEVIIENNDNRYKTILFTGINLSIYGMALMLVPNLSNLIITNYVDVKSVVPYSMSYKLYSTVALFWSSMNIAMSPIMGQEFGKNNWEWIQLNYKRMFITTIAVAIFVICGVMWLGKPFIYIWTGSFDNYPGYLISIFLAMYFFIYALTNLNLVLINAFNYVKGIWIFSWLDGIIFIISSILLIKGVGITGVSIGLFLGSLFISSWGYPLIVYMRSEKRLIYDFKVLMRYLILFMFSVFAYILVEKYINDIIVQVIIDFIGIIITSIMIFILLPKKVRNIILIKVKLKKEDHNEENCILE